MTIISSTLLLAILYPMFTLIAQATPSKCSYTIHVLTFGVTTPLTVPTRQTSTFVLSNISSNTQVENGFYPYSKGQDPDKVYAIGLCRKDIKQDDCLDYLKNASSFLQQRCPNRKEAIGWYDYCMIRFSDRSIFGIMEINPSMFMWNNDRVSDQDGYKRQLQTLFESMRSEAASGDSSKFAARTSLVPDLGRLYVLVQCTTDLSEKTAVIVWHPFTEIFHQLLDRKVGELMHPAVIIGLRPTLFLTLLMQHHRRRHFWHLLLLLRLRQFL